MKVDITNTAQAQAAEVARHFAGASMDNVTVGLRAQIADLIAKVEALETELEATRDKLQAAGANVDELNAEIAALKTATNNAKGSKK